MQPKLLALVLIFNINECSSQEFTIFPLLGPVVKIPSETYALRPRAVLHCALSLAPGVNYTTQWTGPGHVGIIDPTTNNDCYTVTERALRLMNGSELPGTTLHIHKLSYQDAGVYTCRGRRLVADESASSWASTTIDLELDLDLSSKFNETMVTATTTDSTVKLSCEMRAFIQPDSSLIWEGPNNQRLIHGTGKYQITFSNGSSDAAVDGSGTLVPSRVSTLTILNPETSDQGVYTCSVVGTNKTIDLVIMVNDAKETPAITASSSPDDGSETYATTTVMDEITTNPTVTLTTTAAMDEVSNPQSSTTHGQEVKTVTLSTTAMDEITNPQSSTTHGQKVKSGSKSNLYYVTTAAALVIITSAGVVLQHCI